MPTLVLFSELICLAFSLCITTWETRALWVLNSVFLYLQWCTIFGSVVKLWNGVLKNSFIHQTHTFVRRMLKMFNRLSLRIYVFHASVSPFPKTILIFPSRHCPRAVLMDNSISFTAFPFSVSLQFLYLAAPVPPCRSASRYGMKVWRLRNTEQWGTVWGVMENESSDKE